MPPRRQTHPLAAIRAASAVNDQLSEADVRTNAGTQGTAEDLINVIASQLRRALGSESWLYPASPHDDTSHEIYQEVLSGVRDGENVVFFFTKPANPTSVELWLNGMPLMPSLYQVSESAPGAGFDSVVLLIGTGPRDPDQVTANYNPA